MLRFNDIADRVLEYDPTSDLSLLQRAYVYSAKVHEGQERLSGEPYLVHPLEVAGLLVDMRMDDVCVAAGLLHDTVEDTLSTVEEIERLFGDEVAFLVDGLTKISKIEFTSVRERQAENFRKMLLAMSKDIRILLIKLADRLHNMVSPYEAPGLVQADRETEPCFEHPCRCCRCHGRSRDNPSPCANWPRP